MSLYTWLIWGLVGFMFGIVLYICTGPLLGPKLSDRWSQKLSDFYIGQSMMMADRAMLARRKHGPPDLFATDYDVTKESEKTKISGEERHFEDKRGLMSTLGNRPFGLVDERYNVFLDVMTADIAAHIHRFQADEEHERLMKTGEGDDVVRMFTRFMPLSTKLRNVDISDSVHLLSGSASPEITSTVEEYTKLSQEGFKKADVVFLGSIAFMFSLGFGLVFLAYYVGVDSGGGTDTVTFMANPLGWMV